MVQDTLKHLGFFEGKWNKMHGKDLCIYLGEGEIKLLIIVFKLNFILVQILSFSTPSSDIPSLIKAQDSDGVHREAHLLE